MSLCCHGLECTPVDVGLSMRLDNDVDPRFFDPGSGPNLNLWHFVRPCGDHMLFRDP